jgi:hypothetical protein
MVDNKKEEEITETEGAPVESAETPAAEEAVEAPVETPAETKEAAPQQAEATGETPVRKGERGNRAQKVGTVSRTR